MEYTKQIRFYFPNEKCLKYFLKCLDRPANGVLQCVVDWEYLTVIMEVWIQYVDDVWVYYKHARKDYKFFS